MPVAYMTYLVFLLSKVNSMPAYFLGAHVPGISKTLMSQLQHRLPFQGCLSESLCKGSNPACHVLYCLTSRSLSRSLMQTSLILLN